MKTLKHVGTIKNTGSKVVVVFRTLPGESNQALVLNPAQLPDSYHDSLMTLIETDQAQDAFEFGEMLFIRNFPDGRLMLKALQEDGRLQKVPTDLIIMNPTPSTSIPLDQLNVLIAEQRNCSIDDLCLFVNGAPNREKSNKKSNDAEDLPNVDPDIPTNLKTEVLNTEALSDKDLAKSYRSQADAMYKEAAKLRKQADDLDPPQKKTAKAKETTGV
jgi:hypothetical protein